MKPLTRRELLQGVAAVGATVLAHPWAAAQAAATGAPRYRFGACDWSIGKLGDTQALEVAKTIGLDGVQVSLGTLKNDMHLRRPEVQQTYRDAVKTTGVQVASLAIGEMNEIPYKSDPRTIDWVHDSIGVCSALGCQVVLLAFFYHGDLKGDKAGTDEVVRRLKAVAPVAEKAGVILGIESWLSAEEHMDIVQRVGSKAVQVYYDVANSEKMGYDIYREIRWLGKQGVICEVHAKENGSLLGQGKVDFSKVRAALDEVGYRGWLQIEGAVPSGGEMLPSYQANLKFLRATFG